jgi:hypothetical protein
MSIDDGSACSGDMYAGVLTIVPTSARLMSVSLASVALAHDRDRRTVCVGQRRRRRAIAARGGGRQFARQWDEVVGERQRDSRPERRLSSMGLYPNGRNRLGGSDRARRPFGYSALHCPVKRAWPSILLLLTQIARSNVPGRRSGRVCSWSFYLVLRIFTAKAAKSAKSTRSDKK